MENQDDSRKVQSIVFSRKTSQNLQKISLICYNIRDYFLLRKIMAFDPTISALAENPEDAEKLRAKNEAFILAGETADF